MREIATSSTLVILETAATIEEAMRENSLTRAQARAYDQQAMARGITGLTLMENAARGAVAVLLEHANPGTVGIVCGKGNNTGDGFIMAGMPHGLGRAVYVELVADPATLRGDAAQAFATLAGAEIHGKRT